MKKQLIRKRYGQRRPEFFVCEYDTSWSQSFCAFAKALILYILAHFSPSYRDNHCYSKFSLCGGICVPRQVYIAVDSYVIQVCIIAPISITNPTELYVLALYNLAHSPEVLRRLPRFMARKIRQKARNIHFVSTTLSFNDIMEISIADLASGNQSTYGDLFECFTVEIISVDRMLLKPSQVGWYTKYQSESVIPSALGLLKPYMPLLNDLPEHHLTLMSQIQAQGYRKTALFLAVVFICVEKKKPGFLNTHAGDVFCGVAYAACMLPLVILNTFVQIWNVLSKAWEIAHYKVEEVAPVVGLLPAPEAERAISMPSENSVNSITVNSGKDISFPTRESLEECTCSKCKKRITLPVKKAALPEAQNAQEPILETTNKVDPAIAQTPADSGSGEKPYCGRKIQEAAEVKTSDTDVLLKSACASVFGGFVPPVVLTASESVKNRDKRTGKRRQINRYNGNTSALSVQSMIEFMNTLFPGCYMTDFIKAQNSGEHDIVYLHSWRNEYKCPCCGEQNPRVRDNNAITVYDMPVRNGTGLKVIATLGRAECHNEQCSNYRKTYTETCDFIEPGLKYTKRVHYQMLVAGASSNFMDTSRQMKLLGVPCSRKTIGRLINSLEFKDEVDVQVIGIDDVSYLKGREYFTVIYSLETGHLLKLLPGRNGEGLDEFLDSHPNVSVICRDRSSAYGRLIRKYVEKHPERSSIMQVADRFHLMQNCSDNLRKAYYKSIPYRLAINLKGEKPVIMKEVPKKKLTPTFKRPDDVSKWFYDNTPGTDENGNPVHFTVVIDPRSPGEIADSKEECEAEYQLIRKIRKDYADMGGRFKKGQKDAYLEQRKITYSRFTKYIHMTDEEVENVRNSWRRSAWKEKSFDHFKYIVYKMLKDNHSINDVYWYIKEGKNGNWDKSDARLISYIIETYKQVFPLRATPELRQYVTEEYEDGILVVGRQRLFYALMTLDESKKDKELSPYIDMICDAYPVCKTVKETFKDFHDCIIAAPQIEDRTNEKRQKCIENLDAFIEKHKDDVLCGFASHLKSDLECIRNAILTDYHSGGVEGRNLRVKCYERISFGKGKITTLEKRLKLGFMYTDDSFSIGDVAPWLIDIFENGNADSVEKGTEIGASTAAA